MLELISITTDPALAQRLWALPGHVVMVDLEAEGKRERQAGRNTVISDHTLDDVAALAALSGRGPLMVRTDPCGASCFRQIDAAGELGVDRIMLPMFQKRAEVDAVVAKVDGRCAVTLLAETVAAVRDLDELLADQPPHLDWVHVGLNDLSLERGSAFLFEPVATREIEALARVVHGHGRRFGFGGIGAMGSGAIPAERVLGEHVRVGSSAVILSRTFYGHSAEGGYDELQSMVEALRRAERDFAGAGAAALEGNHLELARAIRDFVAALEGSPSRPK